MRDSTYPALNELEGMVGLSSVKQSVNSLMDSTRVQQLEKAAGLPGGSLLSHFVFRGNPGTGKTTVARLIAQCFKEMGILESGHLVERDRATLVGAYIGHTEDRTREAFEEAWGGMLFIDDAYSLVSDSENDFGGKVIDTLIPLMENDRDQTVVTVAGYPDEMNRFLAMNPGLTSRFRTTIDFPDYTDRELRAIFDSLVAGAGKKLTAGAELKMQSVIRHIDRGQHFGNGRTIRNFFEHCVMMQRNRISGLELPEQGDELRAMLETLEIEDIVFPL